MVLEGAEETLTTTELDASGQQVRKVRLHFFAPTVVCEASVRYGLIANSYSIASGGEEVA